MRKWIAAAMAALLAVSLVGCTGGRESQGNLDHYVPEVMTIATNNGVFTFENGLGDTAILVRYDGKALENDRVEIPAVFHERTVVKIADGAFYNSSSVVSVKIPDSVTTIGDWAFARCTHLEEIELPSGLTKLGKGAFVDCTSLRRVSLGDSLTTLDELTFWQCTALESIAFPDSLTSIGDAALWACTSLREIDTNKVTEIGALCFYNCQAVARIRLSDLLTQIGESAFATEDGTLLDARVDSTSYSKDSVADQYVTAHGVNEAET